MLFRSHGAMIAYYSVDKNAGPKVVNLDIHGQNEKKLRYYLLDEHHTMAEMPVPADMRLRLEPHSVVLVTDYCIHD